MKKFLSFLFVCLLTSASAWGFDVVLDATIDLPAEMGTASPYAIEKDGVTASFSNGLANGSHYRLYKGQTLTICSSVGNITKIVFECIASGDAQYGPGNLTCDQGVYSCYEKIGEWTGNAQCVTFTATTSQVRFTRIIVTIDGEGAGLSSPRISPRGDTYYTPVEVSITCPTSGATIHYTTNGATPSTSSPVYQAPFIVNETTTVKAISVKDGEVSDVVSATYNIEEIGLINLCDLLDVPDDTFVFFDEAQVIYQNNRYLYLKDECGYGLVYGDVGQIYNMGDIIPPGWGGKKKTYNCFPEITDLTGFQPASRNEPLEPEVTTIPMINLRLWGHYIELRDVYIDYENKVVRDSNGNSIPYYPQLNNPVDITTLVTIRAIVTAYGKVNPIVQLYIIDASSIIPPPPSPCCLRELYNDFYQGQVVMFRCPLTSIYQNGNYLYVKDSCEDYGLIYGNAGGPYKNGDQIIGNASWTTYQNIQEVVPSGPWEKVDETDPVEPEVMPIEEVSPDMLHWFLGFENAELDIDNGKIIDETGEMTVFKKFPIDTISRYIYQPYRIGLHHEVNITDVNHIINVILADGDPDVNTMLDHSMVTGFLTLYKGQMEFYPIEQIMYYRATVDGDMNGNGEVDIADVNLVIDLILHYY